METFAECVLKLPVTICIPDENTRRFVAEHIHVFEAFCKTTPRIISDNNDVPLLASIKHFQGGIVYVELDPEMAIIEYERSLDGIVETSQYIKRLETKLSNEAFVKNAPSEIVEAERERLDDAKRKYNDFKQSLNRYWKWFNNEIDTIKAEIFGKE